MKLEWVFVAVFAFMSVVFLWEVNRQGDRFMETVTLFSQALHERDKRLFSLNNRIQTLEKERDVYRRVRDLEKQLRTFCIDGKTEMCGKLRVIER